MASKIEVEEKLKSSAEKYWGAVKNSNELLPKIFPKHYKSIEIIEGDGKSVGTVRLLSYGEEIPIVKTAKEKVEVVDETNKLVSYSVIDGEMLNFYKTLRCTLQVTPKDDGALLKWWIEYEKKTDEVPEPEVMNQMAMATFKELDAYLLAN